MKTANVSAIKLNCQDNCEAPLCPLDCHEKAQWLPDEAICNSKTVPRPSWVKTQRKIQKLFAKGLIMDAECFTIPMLQGMKRVGKGLHGRKPENLYHNRTSEDTQKPSISRRMPLFKAEKRGIPSGCV